MPKIPTALPLPGEETILLGRPYVIESAEQFSSAIQKFAGIRVTLINSDGELCAIPIWTRDTVSRTSKLGAFLTTLGMDTDTWKAKIIKFEKWTKNDRKIVLVQPEPKEKPVKVK